MRIERRNTSQGQSPYAGIDFRLTTSEIRNPDGSVVFRLAVTNREAFRSFVLGLLDHAEVLAPPELRADMVGWLSALATSEAGA